LVINIFGSEFLNNYSIIKHYIEGFNHGVIHSTRIRIFKIQEDKKQKYKLNPIYLIKDNCKRKLKKTAKGAPCIDCQRELQSPDKREKIFLLGEMWANLYAAKFYSRIVKNLSLQIR